MRKCLLTVINQWIYTAASVCASVSRTLWTPLSLKNAHSPLICLYGFMHNKIRTFRQIRRPMAFFMAVSVCASDKMPKDARYFYRTPFGKGFR